MMNEGFWVGFTVYYNAAFRSLFLTTLINVYGPEQGPGVIYIDLDGIKCSMEIIEL